MGSKCISGRVPSISWGLYSTVPSACPSGLGWGLNCPTYSGYIHMDAKASTPIASAEPRTGTPLWAQILLLMR